MKKLLTVWENLQYLVLALVMLGQGITAVNLIFGQALFLVANLISLVRNLVLHRPHADIVKDVACTVLTIIVIVLAH